MKPTHLDGNVVLLNPPKLTVIYDKGKKEGCEKPQTPIKRTFCLQENLLIKILNYRKSVNSFKTLFSAFLYSEARC